MSLSANQADQLDEHSQRSNQFDSHRRSESNSLYQKPGRIGNEGLLEGTGQLRGNLVQHFDFEVLHPQLWLYLYSWYSSDCQIVRYLRRDKLGGGSYKLELYPPSFEREQQHRSFIIGNRLKN